MRPNFLKILLLLGIPLVLMTEAADPCSKKATKSAQEDCRKKQAAKLKSKTGPARAKSCASPPSDLAQFCANARVFYPDAADMQGQEQLTDAVLFWPNLQQGTAAFKVEYDDDGNGRILVEASADPARPKLVAVYLRTRQRLQGGGADIVRPQIFECPAVDAKRVLDPTDLAKTQDYFQLRDIVLDGKKCESVNGSNRSLFIDLTPELPPNTAEDAAVEVYIAVHGEVLGASFPIPIPVKYLAPSNTKGDGPDVRPSAGTPAVQVREVYALDPRAAATPGAVSLERPLLFAVRMSGPIAKSALGDDGEGDDFELDGKPTATGLSRYIKVTPKGSDAPLETMHLALSLGHWFLFGAVSEPHDDTVITLSTTLPVRDGATPVATDVSALKPASPHVTFTVGP